MSWKGFLDGLNNYVRFFLPALGFTINNNLRDILAYSYFVINSQFCSANPFYKPRVNSIKDN